MEKYILYKNGSELMHSSGPWKTHKYVKKINKPNGKVVYEYTGTRIDDPYSTDDNDDSTVDETKAYYDKDGRLNLDTVHTKTINGKGLLDKEYVSKFGRGSINYISDVSICDLTVTKEKGKITQAKEKIQETYNKGSNWIKKKFGG